MGGYYPWNTELNIIEYVTLASTGDMTDFGDLTSNNYKGQTASDSHGGLQH